VERVLLFSSPADDEYDPHLRRNVAEPPLGLLYLAAALEGSALCEHYSLVDGYVNPAEADRLEERIRQEGATQLWISLMSSEGMRCFGDRARKIKEKFPHLKITAGGAYFRGLPEESLRSRFPDYDLVVTGDPDLEIDDVLRAEGIFRPKPLVSHVEVPYPRRDRVDLRTYFSAGRPPHHLVIGARGCNGGCTFCAINRRSPYLRTPREVALEIKCLCAATGIKAFSIIDDVTALNPERFDRYEESLETLPSDIQLDVSWRIDRFSEETADRLADARVRVIRFGVESIDPAVQSFLGKSYSAEQIRRCVRWATERSLSPCLYFLFGFPKDTEAGIAGLLDFMEELARETPVPPYLGIIRVLEGTPLMKLYREHGWIKNGEPVRGLPLRDLLEVLARWRGKYPDFFYAGGSL